MLHDSLVALAAEPSDQLTRLTSAHLVELGVDFDNAKGVVLLTWWPEHTTESP